MSVLSEVLGSINDANENLNTIEDKLFSVQDIEKIAPVEGFEVPEGKEIYTSEGKWLGSVGNNYESLQPIDFFNAVVDNVRDSGMEFDLSKLQYNVRKDSRIIEFRLPTNIVSFKNNVGKQDETKMFLNFWTGFGGHARTEIGLYSHRLICENGMRIINSDIDLKVKHTARMNTKALSFTKAIIEVASKVNSSEQMWKEMNNTEVDVATAEEFVRKLAKIKEDQTYADLHVKKKTVYDGIQEAIQTEFSRTGTTVYGLLSGATYYTNHIATTAKDSESILLASGAKYNEQAQKLALELIN